MSASKMATWKMLDLARLIAGRRLELRGDCSRNGAHNQAANLLTTGMCRACTALPRATSCDWNNAMCRSGPMPSGPSPAR